MVGLSLFEKQLLQKDYTMKKLAILFVAMAALTMFAASVSIANIPAPPTNQVIGFDDKKYEDYTVAECLACHQYFGSTPDTHHMLPRQRTA